MCQIISLCKIIFEFHAKYLSVRYFENAVNLMSDGNLQVSTRAQGKTNYRDITLSKSLVILLRYVWVCWGLSFLYVVGSGGRKNMFRTVIFISTMSPSHHKLLIQSLLNSKSRSRLASGHHQDHKDTN